VPAFVRHDEQDHMMKSMGASRQITGMGKWQTKAAAGDAA
jgi:hypothetical protein